MSYLQNFNNSSNFLGLITRCKDEIFIKEFCDYYLSQGVDQIFIIDDNSEDKSIYENINDNKVNILFDMCKNKAHNKDKCSKDCLCNRKILNKVYNIIRLNLNWLIHVDVDEFITTKKNIKKTIREELKTTFKDNDCIKIPWVMMGCNKRKKNPKSILLENVYRWNHDKKHPNKHWKFGCRYDFIEIKCIFKPRKFNKISDHYPKEPISNNIRIVNGTNNKNETHLHFDKDSKYIESTFCEYSLMASCLFRTNYYLSN